MSLPTFPIAGQATFQEIHDFVTTLARSSGLLDINQFFEGGVLVIPDEPDKAPTEGDTHVFHAVVLQSTPMMKVQFIFLSDGMVLIVRDGANKLNGRLDSWQEGFLMLFEKVLLSLEDIQLRSMHCTRTIRTQLRELENKTPPVTCA